MGEWPRYERAAFLGALRRLERMDFVLKSATNGGNVDVLVMDRAKWEREGWTVAKLADYAERFVDPRNGAAKWWSEWGQVYEHRAVIAQENVLTERQGDYAITTAMTMTMTSWPCSC